MTQRLAISALCLLLSALSAVAQPALLGMPSEVGGQSSAVAAPQTYARTVEWQASDNPKADFYTLTCGSFTTNTTGTNCLVPLVEGTNALVLMAFVTNAAGSASTTVRTNYLVGILRITDCTVLGSSNLLTWTPTNLPPAQTNASGAAFFFRLQPTLTVVVEGRHL